VSSSAFAYAGATKEGAGRALATGWMSISACAGATKRRTGRAVAAGWVSCLSLYYPPKIGDALGWPQVMHGMLMKMADQNKNK